MWNGPPRYSTPGKTCTLSTFNERTENYHDFENNNVEHISCVADINLTCTDLDTGTTTSLVPDYSPISAYARNYYKDSTSQGNNWGASCNNTKNPINIATGNKFYVFQEWSTVPFYQYYNLNSGWTFDYRQRLHLSSNGQGIVATRPGGCPQGDLIVHR